MRISSAVSIAIIAAAIGGVSATIPSPAATAQQSRPSSPSQVNLPLSDARKIGPNSVRFSAAQFSQKAPVIVLFGGNDAVWAKVRGAIQQAVFEGYPVEMVFIGPSTEPLGLEIYAKGQQVLRPFDLSRASAAELTKLVKDVSRQHYGR